MYAVPQSAHLRLRRPESAARVGGKTPKAPEPEAKYKDQLDLTV